MSKAISIFLENEAATQHLGCALASIFKQYFTQGKNLLLTLDGELGTGKTTLVRACLRELGVKGAIKSPTYTLLEPYEIDSAKDYCTRSNSPSARMLEKGISRL